MTSHDRARVCLSADLDVKTATLSRRHGMNTALTLRGHSASGFDSLAQLSPNLSCTYRICDWKLGAPLSVTIWSFLFRNSPSLRRPRCRSKDEDFRLQHFHLANELVTRVHDVKSQFLEIR